MRSRGNGTSFHESPWKSPPSSRQTKAIRSSISIYRDMNVPEHFVTNLRLEVKHLKPFLLVTCVMFFEESPFITAPNTYTACNNKFRTFDVLYLHA